MRAVRVAHFLANPSISFCDISTACIVFLRPRTAGVGALASCPVMAAPTAALALMAAGVPQEVDAEGDRDV
eukprot:CAMPEP_0198459226 /NCGR_PEP_ID=MMETSP1453-20131121/39723_1 /TAXON_ID=1461543 ORGANISM="Unidentified sp., Strain RCC701" /NCGR_SAMPLE_ID=MMETSP1453 /ASSEMBLY_ACC=CAM_ASM_001118 /LENGTH=70 /DNA_ID=CAMNT_0044184181 /DNA_START=47 /DNA_END=254 /DNA_ORIENTATION=-